MSALDTLRGARERIADPSRWTTGWVARDARGEVVDATILAESDSYAAAQSLCYEAIGDGNKSIGEVNDIDGHVAVLAMFDRAIALAEAT